MVPMVSSFGLTTLQFLFASVVRGQEFEGWRVFTCVRTYGTAGRVVVWAEQTFQSRVWNADGEVGATHEVFGDECGRAPACGEHRQTSEAPR